MQALSGIDLDIRPGEFVSILGPSGCGKSTIIGARRGLHARSPPASFVWTRSACMHTGPERGVVFQQHTLFPWKTVAKNVEFGLKMRGVGKAERERRAREILGSMGLSEFLAHYPHQFSGGMQQRVNLARVLVNRPRVILMDEPFCSLDAQTRLQMQELLLSLWHELHMTVVFVTHEVDEALFLSDRVVVLTQRPARIKTEVSVDLPRPRTRDLLTSPEFVGLKRQILELLLGDGFASVKPS